jgi:competence protein ComEA
MKTWQSILLGTFLGLAGAAIILLVVAPPKGEPILLPPTPTPAAIMIYVTGAVKAPGVVSLPRQSRVLNAIEAAGGFSEDADAEAVNLAAKLNDGDRISVPSRSAQATKMAVSSTTAALEPARKGATPTPTVTYPINLNTATAQELEALPGIGPSKSAQIIAYRQQKGPFKKIEEIQNISGFGPATFEKLKDLITVSSQ